MDRHELVKSLLEARSAVALDADADGNLLVASNLSGTMQLFELAPGATSLRPITDFAEPASGAYRPGHHEVVVSMDTGGNECHQLYLADLDDPPLGETTKLRPIAVDQAAMHQLAGVSHDGRLVAFLTNRRNRIDFDLVVRDLETGSERCYYDGGGYCAPSSGFSPDDRYLAFHRLGQRALDLDLLLVDLKTGVVAVVEAHDDEAAEVGPPAWLSSTSFVVSSNVGRDLTALVRHDLGADGSLAPAVTKPSATVLRDGPFDLAGFASPDGSTLLVVANDDGQSRAWLVDVSSGADLAELPLPLPGAMAHAHGLPEPRVAPGGRTVTFSWTSPQGPAEIWRFERETGSLARLTHSPGWPSGVEGIVPELHRLPSFDGEEISVYLYRPATSRSAPGAAGATGANSPSGRPPVVLVVHGGPEGQAVRGFDPTVQALAQAGFAVAVPNVRGSTGYGKRFAGLDNVERRLDSVADLGAIHEWLPSVGLDPDRAALWGGSYGGYMVLAGLAFQPERWAAGVDIVGISDLVTFLENTSPYRRAAREREYGSLAAHREVLAAASPLRRVDAIRAPLFVIHGANDPRVPLSEAEQLVASLRTRGVPCELLVYADEGHGLAKLANRLDAYPRAIEFLAERLGIDG